MDNGPEPVNDAGSLVKIKIIKNLNAFGVLRYITVLFFSFYPT